MRPPRATVGRTAFVGPKHTAGSGCQVAPTYRFPFNCVNPFVNKIITSDTETSTYIFICDHPSLCSVKESSTAMVVARVLTLWSSAALDCLQGETQLCPPTLQQSLSGGSDLHRHLMEHIYSHWEHPLDGVRHQTRSLFRNLLLLHQHSNSSTCEPTNDRYITELAQSILGLEWHMRGKYGALGCLVELYGAGYLLAIQPQLPSCLLGLMGDQTLAPYASDLLERLFVSHKVQLAAEANSVQKTATEDWMELWHRLWVTPMLHVLCHARLEQTTYILDYFLPKLLRCSPSSLSHMVQALQDTPPFSKGKHTNTLMSAHTSTWTHPVDLAQKGEL